MLERENRRLVGELKAALQQVEHHEAELEAELRVRSEELKDVMAQLVKIKRDLENQIRGLLKNHGLVIGKAGGNVFHRRAEELLGEQGLLAAAVRPLLDIREKVSREIAALYRKLLSLARNDEDSRRSMTVPGI